MCIGIFTTVDFLLGVLKKRVLAHENEVILKDCKYKVSEKTRLKIIEEQKKRVCAYVTGYFISADQGEEVEDSLAICFNPYLTKTFVMKQNNEPVFWGRGTCF